MRLGAGRRGAPTHRSSLDGARRRTPASTAPHVVVASSSPTPRSPTWSSSTRRRCTPASRAASTTSAARPGTRAVHGVEEGVVQHLDTGRRAATSRQRGGPAGATPRAIATQPLGAVVDGVHRGGHGQQDLRGADVGGRLVAADVLLAGLQRQPVRRAALGVDRDADEAAGQVPLEAGAHRHVAGVRAAVEQRDAEALGGADRDVGAERCRATRAGSRASRSAATTARAPRSCASSMTARGSRTRPDAPGYCTSTPQRSSAVGQTVGEVGDDHVDAHRGGAGAHHRDRLRQRVGVDDERARAPSGSRAGPASSPRRRRWPRRAATRWRSAARSGRRPWSGS